MALPPKRLKLHCFLILSSSLNWLYAYIRSIFEKKIVLAQIFFGYIHCYGIYKVVDALHFLYLFLCIASFSFLESRTLFTDNSIFTVITTGLTKNLSSEHSSSFIILYQFYYSLSVLLLSSFIILYPLSVLGVRSLLFRGGVMGLVVICVRRGCIPIW